jgi:hypothetical protein
MGDPRDGSREYGEVRFMQRAQGQQSEARHPGVKRGLIFATLFSALVVGVSLLEGSSPYVRYGLTPWQVVAGYYAAGLLGGVLFEIARPWRRRYAGKFFSAYLILFFLYGGCAATLFPILLAGDAQPISLVGILAFWAAACLLLAPAYVWMLPDRTS